MEIHNRLIFKYKTIIVQIRMGSQKISLFYEKLTSARQDSGCFFPSVALLLWCRHILIKNLEKNLRAC